MLNIDIREISHITQAIASYNELANTFSQLVDSRSSYFQGIKDFYDKNIRSYSNHSYPDENFCRHWQDISLHIFKQTWGNTSCGWEGIGGCAMSDDYTLVIVNKSMGAMFIYYSGILAYVCILDTHSTEALNKQQMPGIASCKSSLNVIYIKKR